MCRRLRLRACDSLCTCKRKSSNFFQGPRTCGLVYAWCVGLKNYTVFQRSRHLLEPTAQRYETTADKVEAFPVHARIASAWASSAMVPITAIEGRNGHVLRSVRPTCSKMTVHCPMTNVLLSEARDIPHQHRCTPLIATRRRRRTELCKTD